MSQPCLHALILTHLMTNDRARTILIILYLYFGIDQKSKKFHKAVIKICTFQMQNLSFF